MEFIDRYIQQRQNLKTLLQDRRPDFVAIEYPIFSDYWSEGLYGLFLFCCEALKTSHLDTVFLTNTRTKAWAKRSLGYPRSIKMDKEDMIAAAKKDADGGVWSSDEADAYIAALVGAKFWSFAEGQIPGENLTPYELKTFTEVKTYTRGKKAGKTVKKGLIHKENDQYFRWSRNIPEQ